MLKVYHLEEGKEGKDNIKPRFNDEDLEDHQPFPTLKAALEKLDEHVGFNIEIKWTMQLKASNPSFLFYLLLIYKVDSLSGRNL
jgi:Glycerophosphoryl diester phosphodiesterase family